MEFHHRTQGIETVEQLGIDLQCLGRRAFPSSQGKEFDRLLKGQFFQALHVKWQRKLGAPKPPETFRKLYDRLSSSMRSSTQHQLPPKLTHTGLVRRMSQQANRLGTQLVRTQTVRILGLTLPPPILQPMDDTAATDDISGVATEIIGVESPDHLQKHLVVQILLAPLLLDKYLTLMTSLMSN